MKRWRWEVNRLGGAGDGWLTGLTYNGSGVGGGHTYDSGNGFGSGHHLMRGHGHPNEDRTAAYYVSALKEAE